MLVKVKKPDDPCAFILNTWGFTWYYPRYGYYVGDDPVEFYIANQERIDELIEEEFGVEQQTAESEAIGKDLADKMTSGDFEVDWDDNFLYYLPEKFLPLIKKGA